MEETLWPWVYRSGDTRVSFLSEEGLEQRDLGACDGQGRGKEEATELLPRAGERVFSSRSRFQRVKYRQAPRTWVGSCCWVENRTLIQIEWDK